MTDDEKKKATSLPPPPTDDIDSDWNRPSGSPPEPKAKGAAETSGKNPAADSKSDLTPPWKKTEKAKAAVEEEEEEEEEDEDQEEEDEDEDEEDEEDEDEEDEEDEDEADRRRAAAAKAKGRDHGNRADKKTPPPSASGDWLPDWSPWAVLGGLLFLGFLGGFGVLPLNFNLKPSAAPVASVMPTTMATATSKAKPMSSAAREAMRERRRRAMAADGGSDSETIRASHLLVAYQGSQRSTQTRSKAEAKTRAEEALKRAKKGEDFAKVVAEYTDEPGGGARGGDLNKFGRGRMAPAFEEAAFALKPNELSGIVETPFGFHVIKRTE